jgi:hypothetical protein
MVPIPRSAARFLALASLVLIGTPSRAQAPTAPSVPPVPAAGTSAPLPDWVGDTPPATGGDPVTPPPGDPADQSLWLSLARAPDQAYAAVARWRRTISAFQGYDPLLAELARSGPPALAARASELRPRFREAWDSAYAASATSLRGDMRLGCKLQADALSDAMSTPTDAPRLARARGEARECLDLMQGGTRKLDGASNRSAPFLAEAEKLVLESRAPKSAPPAAADPATSRPAG